jgi:hypothetical protein
MIFEKQASDTRNRKEIRFNHLPPLPENITDPETLNLEP